MKFLASILAALLFAGCVAGSYFSWDNARRIHKGMTTSEVETIMGRPYLVQSLPNGRIKYVYAFGTGFGGSGSFTVLIQDGHVIEVPVIPASFK